ncbi:MAG: hypothetical protein J0I20_11550 [Chloroflexi bacterium]|nr:hypothetical protein [Chloroflexota bacterium]OJV92370.1 MAG: hypothetical protein BGO39_31070 [Chloroflexi bacterium 54-19]
MSSDLDLVKQTLDKVEEKGRRFLADLQGCQNLQVGIGMLAMIPDLAGRPTFMLSQHERPIWFEVYVSTSLADVQGTGLNLDYSEISQEYLGLRLFLREAIEKGQTPDFDRLVLGLTWATLMRDADMAETLNTQLVRYVNSRSKTDESVTVLEDFLRRGNARLRAAYGRVLASVNDPAVTQRLMEFLKEESADGPRAEIIFDLVRFQSLRGLPDYAVDQWLSSSALADVLAILNAANRYSVRLSEQHFSKIQPQYQEIVKSWFKDPKFV